jgi:hypothetical protein
MALDSNTIAALESGSLVLRDFLVIQGKDGSGDPATFAFWTGEDDVSANVVSAQDGGTDSRDFVGGGSMPPDGVPTIVDTIGIEVRTLDLELSQLHPSVLDMVNGNNIRHAVAELFRGLFNPATMALVSTPFARWLGRVDTAPRTNAAVGASGSQKLSLASDAVDLTRTSPELKSDESQKLRSSDRFFQYADTAGEYERRWGQVS